MRNAELHGLGAVAGDFLQHMCWAAEESESGSKWSLKIQPPAQSKAVISPPAEKAEGLEAGAKCITSVGGAMVHQGRSLGRFLQNCVFGPRSQRTGQYPRSDQTWGAAGYGSVEHKSGAMGALVLLGRGTFWLIDWLTNGSLAQYLRVWNSIIYAESRRVCDLHTWSLLLDEKTRSGGGEIPQEMRLHTESVLADALQSPSTPQPRPGREAVDAATTVSGPDEVLDVELRDAGAAGADALQPLPAGPDAAGAGAPSAPVTPELEQAPQGEGEALDADVVPATTQAVENSPVAAHEATRGPQTVQPTQDTGPAIPSPPAASTGFVGADGIRALVCAYDWPCGEALGIIYGNARCPHGESGGDPMAVGAGSYGLWQIQASVWRPYFGEARWAQVFDAAGNTHMAWEIYVRAGYSWSPWSCHP